jgi:hypothetical protein
LAPDFDISPQRAYGSYLEMIATETQLPPNERIQHTGKGQVKVTQLSQRDIIEKLDGKAAGLSFEEMIETHGRQPASRVVHLLRQACRALREAHSIGLIHRDIKPASTALPGARIGRHRPPAASSHHAGPRVRMATTVESNLFRRQPCPKT